MLADEVRPECATHLPSARLMSVPVARLLSRALLLRQVWSHARARKHLE